MGPKLREQFSARNAELELLNERFVNNLQGIRIWTFFESQKTEVYALANRPNGQALIKDNLVVVDAPSASLSINQAFMFTQEERQSLATNHVGTVQFLKENGARQDFVEDLKAFLTPTSSIFCPTPQSVVAGIFSTCSVFVHRFYRLDLESDNDNDIDKNDPNVNVLISPSLRDFQDRGPSQILQAGLAFLEQRRNLPLPGDESTSSNHSVSEDRQPTPSGESSIGSGHTREESEVRIAQDSAPVPKVIVHDVDGKTETKTSDEEKADSDEEDTDLQGRTLVSRYPPVNLEKSNQFDWIHIPANVCDWVPRILKAVSEDKGSQKPYRELVYEWNLHQNRSRYASIHAQFIRTHSKLLCPPRQSLGTETPLASPRTINDSEPQLVLTFPYL